jgi:serine-type D-Ala-D-Ala carboxypeptidase (penicillin-binding protein 5/6)
MLLGAVVAAALVLGVTWPIASKIPKPSLKPITISAVRYVHPEFPTSGPSAFYLPELDTFGAHNDANPVPIASLTKMMTAYVTLQKLPIGANESGPCVTLGSYEVADYREKVATGASSIEVAYGEQICELDLLRGLLVHSAGNYADILASMVTGRAGLDGQRAMVALMNYEAARLGLMNTHYDDVSGYSPNSVSTAQDQVRLSQIVMQSALVRSIVILQSVTEPVAGIQTTFTPLVGVDGVIGIKSGRTAAAGGCDAMAMSYRDATGTHTAYVVVLGARGGDLLTPAGQEALTLAKSITTSWPTYTFSANTVLGHLGWAKQQVNIGLSRSVRVSWLGSHLSVSFTPLSLRTPVHQGEVVGHLVIRHATVSSIPVVAFSTLSAPTIWQRLR